MKYRGETYDTLDPNGLDEKSLIVQEEIAIVRSKLEIVALGNGFQQLDLLLQCALNGVVAAKETDLGF